MEIQYDNIFVEHIVEDDDNNEIEYVTEEENESINMTCLKNIKETIKEEIWESKKGLKMIGL